MSRAGEMPVNEAIHSLRDVASEPGYQFGRWNFATDGSRLFFTRPAFESDVWVMDLGH